MKLYQTLSIAEEAQTLRSRATVLRYTYVVYLVINT